MFEISALSVAVVVEAAVVLAALHTYVLYYIFIPNYYMNTCEITGNYVIISVFNFLLDNINLKKLTV